MLPVGLFGTDDRYERKWCASTSSGMLRSEELYASGKWSEVAHVWPYFLVVSGSVQFERRLLRSAPETDLSLFFTTLPLLQEEGPFIDT